MNIKNTFGFLLIAMLVGVVIAPAPASAAVNCGDTVTKDIKLHSDLDCRGMDTSGLIVGKDGVTVDLNGHRILGTASITASGVASSGNDHVTIENGSIQGFDGAVYVAEAISPTIRDVKVTGEGQSRSGVSLAYTFGADVAGVRAKHLEYGFIVQHGDRNSVRESSASDVALGAYVFDETNARFSKLAFHPMEDGTGLFDTAGAGNQYRDLTVKDPTAYYGLHLTKPQNVTIKHSVTSNTRFAGIYIEDNSPEDGFGAKVVRSVANNNAYYGMYAVSRGTKAAKNSAKGNVEVDCVRVACNEGGPPALAHVLR